MWNKFQYVHSSVVKILCSESQRTGSLDLFCQSEVSARSDKHVYSFSNMSGVNSWANPVSFIFWSVSLPCQIEHMTCLWQMPELSQYMCRANRQHPNKIFLGFYQGIPIWRVRLLTLPAACVSLVFRMSNDSFIFQIVYISLLNFWKEIKSSFYSLSHQFTLSA